MTIPLTALDATFLELEQADEGAHMHIGGAMLFDPLPAGGGPTLQEVRAHLDTRLDWLPRYRQRLSAPRTGGLKWPTWQDDDSFDLRAHVRHATLPAPGDEEELLDWLGDFYSHRLDRRRPLWEMVLLDGLAGDRWALVTKTHHCLVDGVGSVDVAHLLLDATPAAGVAHNQPPLPEAEALTHSWLPAAAETIVDISTAGLRAAQAGAHALMHPRDALLRSTALARLIVEDELTGAPPSSLNLPIGASRRLLVVRASMADVQAIRARLGGTVNDVVLCTATAGVRDLLIFRGEQPPPRGLRAMVPVNVRRDGEHANLGNRILSLFAELPVAESCPERRYARVVAETAKLKHGPQALGASTLLSVTELAPPVLHAALARSLFATRLFNLTITNVPGPRETLYAFGAPMIDVIPMVPLAADHTVGIAVFTYAGHLTFGLTADFDTTPDLDVLAAGIEAEFAALCPAAVGTRD